LNHAFKSSKSCSKYKKDLQVVDVDPCKLRLALLVITLQPFSSLGFLNWKEACLNPELVIQLYSINFPQVGLAQWGVGHTYSI
jgi:hypothetical protein